MINVPCLEEGFQFISNSTDKLKQYVLRVLVVKISNPLT